MPVSLGDSYPCLSDATAATPFDAHYFFQAAWVARRLALTRPRRHVDVGSDVKLVGVLSAFVVRVAHEVPPHPSRRTGAAPSFWAGAASNEGAPPRSWSVEEVVV